MSGTKWSEDTTVKFVNQYVLHECLWNTKNLEHKNRTARTAAFRNIENSMDILNFGEKEIINKIRNIKSTYSQELKKIRDSTKSGADKIHTPSLKWFPILHAVLASTNIDVRKSLGNSDHPDPVHTEHADEAVDEIGSQDHDYISSPSHNVDVSFDSFTQNTSAHSQLIKKRRLSELSSLLSKVRDVSVMNNTPLDENEFDIFGKSVAAQLKMMPLENALQAQQFIQNYITGLRLQLCSASQSTFYTLSPNSLQSNSIAINSPSTQETVEAILKE